VRAACLKRIDLETFEAERLTLSSHLTELHVGRSRQGTLSISAEQSARVHCVLRREGERWAVEDHHSASGTWVNGHRVTHAPLSHGDVIDLYGTLLVFLELDERREPTLEALIDRRSDDPAALEVWADWLQEHDDPLGAQLLGSPVSRECLEGLAELCDTGRLELDFRRGLIEHARIRCTSDSTFQDVDLLGRLVSLRVFRWARSLTIDLCTWTMPAMSRLQSDAAAALRGLLSGAELPALEELSFGYLPTPLPPSHFREALFERLPARFPRLTTSPSQVLPVVRTAWLEIVTRPPGLDFQVIGPVDGQRVPLHTGVWVGASSQGSLRAIAPGVRREGVTESFLVRQEAPQWCLLPVEHGVLLNGRPAVATRLLPGDLITEPRGTTFRFTVRADPPRR